MRDTPSHLLPLHVVFDTASLGDLIRQSALFLKDDLVRGRYLVLASYATVNNALQWGQTYICIHEADTAYMIAEILKESKSPE